MPESQATPSTTAPSAPATKSLWTEYTHQDGRKYYYHTVTKQTVWQKPDELKTPKELALEACPWKEYSTPEGKKYYHNAKSSETVWTAPEDYKTLVEELAEETKAKEKASGPATAALASGTNTTATATATSASAAAVVASTSTTVVTPTPATPMTTLPVRPLTPNSSSTVSIPSPLRHQAIPPASHQHQHQQSGRDLNGATAFLPHQNPSFRQPPFPHQQGARPPRFQQNYVNMSHSAPRPSAQESEVTQTPEFATKQEAEDAFKGLLKETGVTSTWTWEQTMRAVVTNPMYRALKTTAERKTAFHEYVDECRVQERKEEKERQQKQKQDFLDLLKSSDRVTHASRYTTISRIFAEEASFKAIEDDRLRFSIFDGFVGELVRQEKEEARQRRKAGMAALLSLYQSMDGITLLTKWSQVQEMLQESTEFKDSDAMNGLNKVDQLSVFEDHIKQLEKEYDQNRIRERVLRKRTERKRREAFKELLTELRTSGQLNAKSCWMQIHPLIKEDPRYISILGQPGSTPMELFWDLIEDLDERLYQDRKVVQTALSNMDYQVQPETTFDEFQAAVSKQEKAADILTEDLKLIFDQLLGKAIHHNKEEKRRQEKLARKKAESFRFMLKNLDPAVTVDSAWDDVKVRAESTTEYVALETDEKRKEIFDRYIERLKERVSKTHDSDDEDGSILEDDADLNSRRTGTAGTSSSRAPSTGNNSKSNHNNNSSSSRHSQNNNHHNSNNHGESSRKSNMNSRDAPASSTLNSVSSSSGSKRPHQSEKPPRSETLGAAGSGSEEESEQHDHPSKKTKTEGTETPETEVTKDVPMKDVNGDDDQATESAK
ncbi:hypothetical protein BGZ95_009210 [Linnemannia exigua]|uniref:Uncharacterized protein n=1 Tax=Linnemannia exigua TaxID=604196 RepID=A0AAD4DDK9_9FUNG|nr:hypothetical protein BGZ95_009210 [Linnemannia exigua]